MKTANERQRVSHASGAGSGSPRASVLGGPGGEAPWVNEEYAREKPMRIKFNVEYDGVPPKAE
jgi:hypothetical protein